MEKIAQTNVSEVLCLFQGLTILDKVHTLLLAHSSLKVGITVPIDVSTARPSNGKWLPHTHATQWNREHLGTGNTVDSLRNMHHSTNNNHTWMLYILTWTEPHKWYCLPTLSTNYYPFYCSHDTNVTHFTTFPTLHTLLFPLVQTPYLPTLLCRQNQHRWFLPHLSKSHTPLYPFTCPPSLSSKPAQMIPAIVLSLPL